MEILSDMRIQKGIESLKETCLHNYFGTSPDDGMICRTSVGCGGHHKIGPDKQTPLSRSAILQMEATVHFAMCNVHILR